MYIIDKFRMKKITTDRRDNHEKKENRKYYEVEVTNYEDTQKLKEAIQGLLDLYYKQQKAQGNSRLLP